MGAEGCGREAGEGGACACGAEREAPPEEDGGRTESHIPHARKRGALEKVQTGQTQSDMVEREGSAKSSKKRSRNSLEVKGAVSRLRSFLTLGSIDWGCV